MHPLDSFAKEAEKIIKCHEKDCNLTQDRGNCTYPFQHRGESLTQATIRTASKHFHDTQYHCEELVCHLKSQGAVPQESQNRSVVYYRFIGNRFHIYFLNAGLLFAYAPTMQDFFQAVQAPKNEVQMAVRNALSLGKVQMCMRALGLVGKIITGPWMRMVGGKAEQLGTEPLLRGTTSQPPVMERECGKSS